MTKFTQLLMTMGLAMVPVIELRGAVPMGVSMGLPLWPVLACSVIGNMIPVPFIMLFIRKIFDWMEKQNGWLAQKVVWLEERARRKGEILHKYELIGLYVLVAIPLPGTGAWTGALVATLFDLRMKHAVPIIFLGVVTAGIIMSILSYGVAALF